MNAKILGTALTVTSTIKSEDILKLAQFDPEALQIRDPEHKRSVVYAIGKGCTAHIKPYGITFNGTNSEGFATATIEVPNVENKEELVKEAYGLSLLNLQKMEEKLVTAVSELNAKFATVAENITLLD